FLVNLEAALQLRFVIKTERARERPFRVVAWRQRRQAGHCVGRRGRRKAQESGERNPECDAHVHCPHSAAALLPRTAVAIVAGKGFGVSKIPTSGMRSRKNA